jgi:carbonic anhydrase/acetyltransferase-like protein (isoleucine patch superfamily)
MLRKNPTGHYPQVSVEAFVDPTAILCGNVIVEKNVFIGPYVVIRADEVNEFGTMEPILIKCDSNIQDGFVIHSKAGAAVTIGECTSIAHRSIVHGPCEVGDRVFIGFNTVLFRTHIGKGCVIRHNCVIDGLDIPDNFHIPPMTNIGPGFNLMSISSVPPEYSSFSESVVSANHALVEGYKRLANEF